jgi:hypothetical protein
MNKKGEGIDKKGEPRGINKFNSGFCMRHTLHHPALTDLLSAKNTVVKSLTFVTALPSRLVSASRLFLLQSPWEELVLAVEAMEAM